jgi:hypothetical protein
VVVAIAAMVERSTHFNVFYSLWGTVTSLQPPPELDKIDAIGRLAVDGPTAEPLELAALLAIVLPFAIAESIRPQPQRRRMIYVLATAILLAGAFSTGRKTGVVAPALGLLVLIAYRPRAMLKAVVVASLPLLAVVHLMVPGQIGSTFLQLLPGHATTVLTTKDRVARYDAVRPDLMSHLLLGRGFQSYDPNKYRILDNEFLGLLIGVGVIGLAAYVAIFGGIFTLAHPMIRGPDSRRATAALGSQAAIATTMVANALFDELSFTHVSYLFFFIAAMVVALRVPTPSEPPARAGTECSPHSGPIPASRVRWDGARFVHRSERSLSGTQV